MAIKQFFITLDYAGTMFSLKASVLKLISTEPSQLDLGSTLALLQVTPVTHVKAFRFVTWGAKKGGEAISETN